MKRQLVKLKGLGVRGSLLLILDDQVDFDTLLKGIDRKFSGSSAFFNGGRMIVDVGERRLNNRQKIELLSVLEGEYGLTVHNIVDSDDSHPGFPQDFDGRRREEREAKKPTLRETRFIEGTIRSGQEIRHDGHLVIVGDINPGAEVVASGNILVFGRVRGVIHAGAAGDREAFIGAVRLEPIQLRIAEFIARAPDGEEDRPHRPEIARVVEDQVVIGDMLV